MKIYAHVVTGLAWSASAWLGADLLAQSFLVRNLGTPDGLSASASEAHAINRSGGVVGTWWPITSPHGSQYAFLYSTASNANLGTIKPSGYDFAIAYGINGSNAVVGQGTTSGSYVYHAFLWTNGVMADLDTTGQSWSSANAISPLGQIVGEMTTSNGAIHAFIYSNGAMSDLGTLPSGDYSSAKGINSSGVVVGESTELVAGSMVLSAFVRSNGPMQHLGTLGGNYSSARAINDTGDIVGESNTAGGQTHAFRYRNGVMTDLGTLGGTNSTAAAVNNSGQVVGYALTTNSEAHAFLFQGGALLDLQALFSPAAGWTNVFLTLGYGINDAGQIVGGVNWFTNGPSGRVTNYDAFLLTAAPTLGSPVFTNSHFRLAVAGATGLRFTIEASSDLHAWAPVSTNTLAADPLVWTDATAASSSRFYRAHALP